MRQFPDPTYEREILTLVNAFKRAVTDILRELNGLDIADLKRANTISALSAIAKILASLNEESTVWVAENIPLATRDGVARTLVSLGVVDTLEEAEKIVKFNRINAELVKSAVVDTQADLLAVTQNVDRKVRAAIRKASADSMRANMASGINGRRTITRDILTQIRQTLGDAVNTGIIDAAGRRWRPEVYVDMAVRTKMAQTHLDATQNEAIGRGALYGVVSTHGATDACAKYEGKIVKLTPDADGDYPYIGDLRRTNEIWHPNCKHQVSPVRNPENLRGV